MNRLDRETGHRLPKRGRQGFALIAVLGIAAVLLLLVSTLFLKAGVAHQDGISERSSTDSFYAAEAGMQTLTGRLSQLQFGSAAIPKAQLQINGQQIIANTTTATQASVTADVANGQLKTGQAYGSTGAIPQNLGSDLGYVIYSFKAYNGNTTICTQLCNLPASGVTRVEVEVLGFKGRSAATTLKTSINAGTGTPQTFLPATPTRFLP